MYVSRAGLKPIGPIASNWALRLRGIMLVLSTLGCSSTHNNTLQVVIENHWAPHLLRPALYVILCHGVFILYLNVLLLAQIIHNGMWAIAIILRPLSINISFSVCTHAWTITLMFAWTKMKWCCFLSIWKHRMIPWHSTASSCDEWHCLETNRNPICFNMRIRKKNIFFKPLKLSHVWSFNFYGNLVTYQRRSYVRLK